MKHSEMQHDPIAPAMNGQPPTWIVICLDCGWLHAAHGLTPDDTSQAADAQHERMHRLLLGVVIRRDQPNAPQDPSR